MHYNGYSYIYIDRLYPIRGTITSIWILLRLLLDSVCVCVLYIGYHVYSWVNWSILRGWCVIWLHIRMHLIENYIWIVEFSDRSFTWKWKIYSIVLGVRCLVCVCVYSMAWSQYSCVRYRRCTQIDWNELYHLFYRSLFECNVELLSALLFGRCLGYFFAIVFVCRVESNWDRLVISAERSINIDIRAKGVSKVVVCLWNVLLAKNSRKSSNQNVFDKSTENYLWRNHFLFEDIIIIWRGWWREIGLFCSQNSL